MYTVEDIREVQRSIGNNHLYGNNLSIACISKSYSENEISYDAYDYLLLVISRVGK